MVGLSGSTESFWHFLKLNFYWSIKGKGAVGARYLRPVFNGLSSVIVSYEPIFVLLNTMVKRRYAILTWNWYPVLIEGIPCTYDAADALIELAEMGELFSWVIGQHEVGEQGTPHIQALVYSRDGLNFKKITASCVGCFLKSYDENVDAMRAYVTKTRSSDYGTQFEGGICPVGAKGASTLRSRSAILCHKIMTKEIVDEKQAFQEFGSVYLKTYKGVQHCLNLMKEPKAPVDPDTIQAPVITTQWLYGETGTGKSRRAYKQAFLNNKTLFKKASHTKHWWDGYAGEEMVLLDDFRGSDMSFHEFLQLTDPYRPLEFPVQHKGGTTILKAKYFIVTSPKHPIDCWKCTRKSPSDWGQLYRRLGAINHCWGYNPMHENPLGYMSEPMKDKEPPAQEKDEEKENVIRVE